MFWGPRKALPARVGGRGGTPLFDFKNNTLVYLYLLPSLGASTGSLVGSSLEPAAGFMGSASAADFFSCMLVSFIPEFWDGGAGTKKV